MAVGLAEQCRLLPWGSFKARSGYLILHTGEGVYHVDGQPCIFLRPPIKRRIVCHLLKPVSNCSEPATRSAEVAEVTTKFLTCLGVSDSLCGARFTRSPDDADLSCLADNHIARKFIGADAWIGTMPYMRRGGACHGF